MTNFNLRNPPEGSNFKQLLRFAWDHGCGNRLTQAGDPRPWTYESLEAAFDTYGHSVDQRTIQNWLSGKNIPSRRNIYVLTRILSQGDEDIKRKWMDEFILARQSAQIRKKKIVSKPNNTQPSLQVQDNLTPKEQAFAQNNNRAPAVGIFQYPKLLFSIATIVLISLVLAAISFLSTQRFENQSTVIEKSVAVLPFEDLYLDQNDSFFANGISEDIINGLAQISDLSVRSRTAAFRYKDSDLSLQKIASDLDANYLLEGSFRKTGDNFRITARLIRARDGELLWADSFTDDIDEIFTTQEKIARSITSALDIYIDDTKRAAMFDFGTRNVEAYQHYLKGRSLLKNWHETSQGDDIWVALASFQAATKADPNMAKAYFHSVDPYFHFAKGEISAPPAELKIAMPTHPRTVQDTITDLLDKATIYAANDADAAQYEVNKIIFSKNWTGLRQASRRFGELAVKSNGELEWEFGPIALLITGEDDVLQRLVKDRILKFDPNNGTGHSYAVRSHLLKSNLDKAKGRLNSANATTFSRRLEEVEAYLHFKNGDLKALEAHLLNAKSLTESRTDYFSALALILRGQHDLAIKKLSGSTSLKKDQPQLALGLMHAGDVQASKEILTELNANWIGPLNFTAALAYGAGCGDITIHLMPELKQRFAEANIETIPCAILEK